MKERGGVGGRGVVLAFGEAGAVVEAALEVSQGTPEVAVGGVVGAAEFGVGGGGGVDFAARFEFALAGAGVSQAVECEAFAKVRFWEGLVEFGDEGVEIVVETLGRGEDGQAERFGGHGEVLSDGNAGVNQGDMILVGGGKYQ